MKKLYASFLSLYLSIFLFGQSSENTLTYAKKTYDTQMIGEGEAPKIDGLIDEAVWDKVAWGEDFTVDRPNNGEKPRRQTIFKILYDSDNLYVAFRCFHEDPSKIENRMSRRDNFPGDWVALNIDSYFDKSTAFAFTTSVSGVQGDSFVSGNGDNWDRNWNPVWYTKTHIDDKGWTGEIRIPMSQLRFGDKENHIWGFNIMRKDFGADERSTWQWIPQNAAGWVSNFGELHGISGLKPKKQIEIQPFVVASTQFFEREEGNPFDDGSRQTINFGLDGKFGVTSDLTLDFTFNPDFGQVEADPSAIALDGFQIFFDERRPFFVENANLFGFPVSRFEAGGPFGNDNLFYSRRIGASPSGSVDLPEGDYIDVPDFTTIIGAGKLSGKTKDGWGISILESVTAEEVGMIDHDGERSDAIVEPLTNFIVAGLSKDLRKGQTVISGKLTSVYRNLHGTGLEDQYHRTAISGGIDVFHSWKDREWQMRANYIFSNVTGTETRIRQTQESFEHYFQRPDADHLDVNEAMTSLNGAGGSLSLGNYGGNDNLSFQTGVTWRSPGLELNDIGFLNTADEINHVTWVGYRFPRPFSVFRSLRINGNHFQRWTTGGEYLYNAVNANVRASFNNYWSFRTGTTYEIKDVSAKALFGGPILKRSPGFYTWIDVESDNRKRINYGLNVGGGKSTGKDAGAVRGINFDLWLSAQPSDRLRISVSPELSLNNRVIQNVTDRFYKGNHRYITAKLDQETFSMSMRFTYSLTPYLSIQYWGQPFISKATFSEYKYITDPFGPVYTDRFALYTQDQITYDSEALLYSIDENRDGQSDYAFDDPNFNFMQFRSNLVMRWEYRPGSEFFLVWTQSTTNFGDPFKDLFPSLTEDLFSQSVTNIFLLKLTYRFYNF